MKHSLPVALRDANGQLRIVEKRAKRGKAQLSEEERRAQATIMMVKRLFGEASLKELGEEFAMDPRTVQRRLANAREDGIPDEARRVFIEDLLPASIVVLKEALEGDDLKLAVQVATKVVEGLKVLDDPTTLNRLGSIEESFEAYRERITLRRTRTADPSNGGAIDAEALPPANPEGAEDASPANPETAPLHASLSGPADAETAQDSPRNCEGVCE